ncbi:hypothetical protein DAEQUDRAFT_527794 [Daedalea quercina L-15889]|uniref:Uncharacterized protein n=1 Tax=Daedalea quercina L-15889 TaxID=1314783 RepID=A0A165M9Y2_9APHY|nr:hypothetical protein DAEQUDRAFT_527794 [Daedalea quercina L-15889]
MVELRTWVVRHPAGCQTRFCDPAFCLGAPPHAPASRERRTFGLSFPPTSCHCPAFSNQYARRHTWASAGTPTRRSRNKPSRFRTPVYSSYLIDLRSAASARRTAGLRRSEEPSCTRSCLSCGRLLVFVLETRWWLHAELRSSSSGRRASLRLPGMGTASGIVCEDETQATLQIDLRCAMFSVPTEDRVASSDAAAAIPSRLRVLVGLRVHDHRIELVLHGAKVSCMGFCRRRRASAVCSLFSWEVRNSAGLLHNHVSASLHLDRQALLGEWRVSLF